MSAFSLLTFKWVSFKKRKIKEFSGSDSDKNRQTPICTDCKESDIVRQIDSPEGAWRLNRKDWSEETYLPLPAGELDQGTSVKPPAMWPVSALTSTSEGEAPSQAAWKALACKYCQPCYYM